MVVKHLIPTAREMLELSDKQRCEALEKDLWIGYPAAQAILGKMRRLYFHPPRTRMPNLLIVGPTNNGKTMLKEKFYKSYLATDYRHESDFELKYSRDVLIGKSIISIDMPVIPNVKRFLAEIAEAIERKNLHWMNRHPMEKEIISLLKEFGIKMLIIDEIHNILAGGNKQQLEFLNLLRYLGNQLKVPIVGMGTRDAYLAIRTDPQLENRFEPCLLPLWQEDRAFRQLLESFVSVLPLKNYSELSSTELSHYIFLKTGGFIGEISRLLREAAQLAIQMKKEKIDLGILKALEYESPSERQRLFEKAIS